MSFWRVVAEISKELLEYKSSVSQFYDEKEPPKQPQRFLIQSLLVSISHLFGQNIIIELKW